MWSRTPTSTCAATPPTSTRTGPRQPHFTVSRLEALFTDLALAAVAAETVKVHVPRGGVQVKRAVCAALSVPPARRG